MLLWLWVCFVQVGLSSSAPVEGPAGALHVHGSNRMAMVGDEGLKRAAGVVGILLIA